MVAPLNGGVAARRSSPWYWSSPHALEAGLEYLESQGVANSNWQAFESDFFWRWLEPCPPAQAPLKNHNNHTGGPLRRAGSKGWRWGGLVLTPCRPHPKPRPRSINKTDDLKTCLHTHFPATEHPRRSIYSQRATCSESAESLSPRCENTHLVDITRSPMHPSQMANVRTSKHR